MIPLWILLLLILLACAWRAGWLRAGLWFALALFAQANALELYEAGPVVGYHHYRPHGDPQRIAFALAALGLQFALVGGALWTRREDARAALRRILPGWRLPAVVAALLAISAKISRPAQTSAAEFVFATLVELASVANLALAASALAGDRIEAFDRRVDSWLGPRLGTPDPGGLDRFAWTFALLSFLAALFVCRFVFEAHPHVPDEVVYLLHARYFAAGKLSLLPPPVPEGFDLDLMMLEKGRWYSPVPIGWPLALAAGALVHAPWLVNPLLGGATILVAYLFLREALDLRAARWSIFLLAASPWFLFLNASLMTHTWTLFCAVLAALGVARSRRTGSIAWSVVAGAAIGMVSLIRPLEGAVLALALGLVAIGLGGKRLRVPALAALVGATALVGALVFPYNAHMTGSATLHPIQHYVDVVYGPGKNDMGFGPDKGLAWGGLDPWPGHTPFQALVNAQFNSFATNAELFGWSAGSLFFVLVLFALGGLTRFDGAMLGFAAAIVVANSFYWFSGGPDFGARYWYLVILPCVVLTVSGMRAVQRRIGEPARVRAALFALSVFALASFVPWRATDKYTHYRGMRADVRELAAKKHFGRSLVLVRGERHPDYASAAVYNPLDLEADAPIYAWDKDAAVRAKLLEHYADRPVWIVDGPSLTGEGYRVARGPIAAAELAQRGEPAR